MKLNQLIVIGILFMLSLILCSCSSNPSTPVEDSTEASTEATTEEMTETSTEASTEESAAVPLTLLETATAVTKAIASSDYTTLDTYVHTEKGLSFSPYAYIIPDEDQHFDQGQLSILEESDPVYTWGDYDGSGEPMVLDAPEYIQTFVWNADYLNAPLIGQNQKIGSGNTLFNVLDVYPTASYVEFHFPGFDETYEGMDWSSLILVFEQVDGDWKLFYIVHDQWTI